MLAGDRSADGVRHFGIGRGKIGVRQIQVDGDGVGALRGVLKRSAVDYDMCGLSSDSCSAQDMW